MVGTCLERRELGECLQKCAQVGKPEDSQALQGWRRWEAVICRKVTHDNKSRRDTNVEKQEGKGKRFVVLIRKSVVQEGEGGGVCVVESNLAISMFSWLLHFLGYSECNPPASCPFFPAS